VEQREYWIAAKGMRLELEEEVPMRSQIRADYMTVVDCERRYIDVSDSFCELVGYKREELLGKKYDELTAPDTNDVHTIFRLFIRDGYMHGLWILVHRTGERILVRYDSWVRPDCLIQSNMELVTHLTAASGPA
jgi:PAS domain S-box-containing protein